MKSILYIFSTLFFFVSLLACEFGSGTEEVQTIDNDTPTQIVSNKDTKSNDEGTKTYSNEVKGVKPIKGGPDSDKIQRIGFYNVENLFDTKDDPKKEDEEFTPKGRSEWTVEKYEKKLKHLAKVIDYMGQPGIMGLSEVENKTVLKDLINESSIRDAKYGFVHNESPDIRGIDVALLYSRDEYKLLNKEFIKIKFPRSIVENYTTRELLHATLQNEKKEYIHVFVCHWPSRRGGEKESEPKRVYVAQQLKKEVDKVFKEYEGNHVVIVGDLNDEPANKSVNQTLYARPEVSDPKAEQLYDLTYALERKGYGSYNFRGEWNMLDHIIVSGSLLDGKKTDVENAKVFNRDFMLFYHKKSGQYRPNRTLSGDRYFGGYSDHLPVSVEIGTK